jgi:hypothetical protein
MNKKIAKLICALRLERPLEAANLQRIMVFAADYQYYRGYSALNKAVVAKQPAPFSYGEMVEAIRKDAKIAIEEILKTGTAVAKGYTKAEHYITPHWENAVYYATYLTEKRLGNAEPMLPLVVAGIVDDQQLILDWHEQAASANRDLGPRDPKDPSRPLNPSAWASPEEITTQQLSSRSEQWLDFMHSQFGPGFDKILTKFPEYKNEAIRLSDEIREGEKAAIHQGDSAEVAKSKEEIKRKRKQLNTWNQQFFEEFARDDEIIRHSLNAVHEDTKQQVRLPTSALAELPVAQVFIGLATSDDEVDWKLVTSENLETLLSQWTSLTTAKFKELKVRNQKFHGMDEGFTSVVTF